MGGRLGCFNPPIRSGPVASRGGLPGQPLACEWWRVGAGREPSPQGPLGPLAGQLAGGSARRQRQQPLGSWTLPPDSSLSALRQTLIWIAQRRQQLR